MIIQFETMKSCIAVLRVECCYLSRLGLMSAAIFRLGLCSACRRDLGRHVEAKFSPIWVEIARNSS